MTWELHRPFLQKAESLAEQLATAPEATQTKYYRNQSSATLDKYISRSKYYSNEYQVGYGTVTLTLCLSRGMNVQSYPLPCYCYSRDYPIRG